MRRKKIAIMDARQLFWLAVAEAAQKGRVVCPEAPVLDGALYRMTLACAASGIGIDDDVRASIAMSEAELPVWPTRWRKDGFACGVQSINYSTVRIPGFKKPIRFATWSKMLECHVPK